MVYPVYPIIHRVSTILLVVQDFATIHSRTIEHLAWEISPDRTKLTFQVPNVYPVYVHGFA